MPQRTYSAFRPAFIALLFMLLHSTVMAAQESDTAEVSSQQSAAVENAESGTQDVSPAPEKKEEKDKEAQAADTEDNAESPQPSEAAPREPKQPAGEIPAPAPVSAPAAPPEPMPVADLPQPTLQSPDRQERMDEEHAGENGLSEIVVTASRRKTSWKDAPAMVTIISKRELEKAPEATIDDVLKRVPSISYSRVHAAECGPGRDITLRGIHDQKRTLILVDGIPANDGVTGAVNWSMIPKEAVDRIEIVRGPMSAVYGSGAMGGVINIITRKPSHPNETTIKGGYGSLNTYSAMLLQSGMFDKVGYVIGGNLYKSDGYIQAIEEKEYHVKNARTDVSIMGKAFVKPDDRSLLTLRVNYVNEDYSRGIRTDNQNNETTALSLSYEREMKNNINLSASAYAQIMARKVELGARPNYAELDHTEYDDVVKVGQLFQTDFRIADFNTITVGLDTAYAMMDKHNDYVLVEREAKARGNQLLFSMFAQDEMKFVIDKHTILLTPGLRIDYSRSSDGKSSDTNPAPNPAVDEEYPDRHWVAINPKLSLVYRYDDSTTLRASAGRSFAAPTLFELYTVFTRGPMLLFSNPELDPESAWSAEIGVDQWFMHNFLGRLTGYYTRGFNFIGSRTIATNQLKMDNITEVQIMGLDAELRYKIDSMWTLYGGYTFNWSTVITDEADSSTEGNHLPFEPVHRARLGVLFTYLRWIAVDLSARYEGERYTDFANSDDSKLDHYVSLDLALSGDITRYLRWTVALENLLNVHYDIYSVPTDKAEAQGFIANGYLTLNF